MIIGTYLLGVLDLLVSDLCLAACIWHSGISLDCIAGGACKTCLASSGGIPSATFETFS
jgi:hypothetical protein